LETEARRNDIALFSEDGKNWKEQDGTEVPFKWSPDERVTRVVIGSLDEPKTDGKDDDEKVDRDNLAALPDNLGEIYPNLTHLHIWRQTMLLELPELPPKLIGLDVRFCSSLEELPLLPQSLRSLDLGGCERIDDIGRLPTNLSHLYFNDCRELRSVNLRKCNMLIELDASNSPAIGTLERLPRSIAKLVLKGSDQLSSVEGLEEFASLHHLNLSSCSKLTALSEIPDGIQYLELHSNEQLKYYKNQTIGPYDRGTQDSPNVAERIYVRKVFGDDLRAAAQSKLLFLGDGRVGKTTLSKALQWFTLSTEQRASDEFDHIKPNSREPYTRDITFSLWQTDLQIDTEVAEELNVRAATAKIPAICDADGNCGGSVRMWDFAGQELYHQTHRIFAAEGSVFVLVWSVDTREAIDRTEHNVTAEEWDEWNRQRSLDYWLDYIDSIRPDASITLVCTGCSDGKTVRWQDRAPKHEERSIKAFYVDSLDPGVLDPDLDTANTREFRALVEHLRRECGKEAARLGILQPAYYSVVREHLDNLVVQNTTASASDQVLMRSIDGWYADLVKLDDALVLEPRHLDAVTGYLNDSGMVIRISSTKYPAVLIDQSWGASAIYQLLQRPPGGSQKMDYLCNIIMGKRGLFNESDLESVAEWQKIESPEQKQLLLNYMEQSGIVVRILSADEHRSRDDSIYLATLKYLLPRYEHIEGEITEVYQSVRTLHGAEQLEFSFENRSISEFEFRQLMAHLAGAIGRYMHFWQNGLQVTDDPLNPQWCFLLFWEPQSEGDYYGLVDASLATSEANKAELVQQFEKLMAEHGSPFANRTIAFSGGRIDLQEVKLPRINATEFDLAISSSGAPLDTQVVELLKCAAHKEGLTTFHYRDLPTHAENNTLDVMAKLPKQKVLLLCVSSHYMNLDNSYPAQKWFCMYELADAIRSYEAGKLPLTRILILFIAEDMDTAEEANQALDKFIDNFKVTTLDNFQTLYDFFLEPLKARRGVNASEYKLLSDHFYDAINSSVYERFFIDRTRTGSYIPCIKSDGSYDISNAIARIKAVLSGET
jgi:GTPase SAR1 family protein